ncbi:MAG: S8 family serine peptidase [Rubrivivax sp.]|nr:S8 family serine peptidase [Rubrivivax sp.]
MTGANIAQTAGWTGAGIRVGIIDTGIDIDHPDLGGNGTNGSTPFPSARVAYGHDFVGDAYDYYTSPNPVPDDNPDDCNGHGTHVAGIVGANGAVKGVAPGVTFGAYRIFGCNGSVSDDIIIAALERALADGMNVVNLSLGSPHGWPQSPDAMAASRLANLGVVVVASIGNNGPQGGSPDGLYAAGAPGVGTKVIGVASYDNLQATKPAFSATPDGRLFGYTSATGAPTTPLSGSLPMAKTGTTTAANDACEALTPGSLTGKAALVRRGTCSFYTKAFNAQEAGASAVILYNNQIGEVSPTVAGSTPAITVPVVMVTQSSGEELDGRITAEATTLTWTAGTAVDLLPTGDLISGFSSFGLAPDLSLKPNITAPGGSIYSTYPLENGGYASLGGTSMSSPHVAGGAALVLQARRTTRPDDMKTLLQNSADPRRWSLGPDYGFLDHVHRQGAGMMDIPQAIASRVMVEPSEIALGESVAGGKKITLKVSNTGPANVTYAVSHEPALANGPGTFVNQLSYYDAPATVRIARPTVTVRSRGSENVDITFRAPDDASLDDRGLYGGYIVLTPQGGGQPLRVPYAGFKGDYQAIQVLTSAGEWGFPWLAKLYDDTFWEQPTGATYSLIGDDIPWFLAHFDHHAEEVLLEALDVKTGKVVGKVSDDKWFPRNATPTQFFTFTWNGDVYVDLSTGKKQWSSVKNGDYVVRITVKKPLAQKNNPAHVETWTSPRIKITRGLNPA